MKLAILVPQYFYQHRKMSLPGIGIFSLDDSVAIPDASDKNYRDFIQHIKFTQANVARAEDGLIEFIRTHTGKIKPLAESDLESYVADGKLMLNIGKPFHIEGIGTLVKNRNAVYEFTPGEPTTERMEVMQPLREKQRDTQSVKEKSSAKKEKDKAANKKSVFDEDYYAHESKGVGSRKIMIVLGVVLGLAVVVWGGYSLYNSKVDNTANTESNTNILEADTTHKQAEDSMAIAKRMADSIQAASGIAPGSYKFIFESTPNKKRAIRRHSQVWDISRGIKLGANADSTLFSIYVILPSTPADTIRLKDSLNAWYYGSRPLRVTIGH